jgi:hypothetical protein
VRLAASTIIAAAEGHLALNVKSACDVILDGYRKSLDQHGLPFVLEEEHKWLRTMATGVLRDPEAFWNKMNSLPKALGEIPASAEEALEHLMPERHLTYRLLRRIAGLGSLGRVRLVAVAECHGGRVAREAKALVPSAIHWMDGGNGPGEIMYQAIISRAVRCPDPFVQVRGRWIVRRLSPHCSRIELNMIPRNRDELKMLFSMGWETANIHLGSQSAIKEVRRHLGTLKPNWLYAAAKDMAKAVTRDWQSWREAMKT